jgi:hypothetical protein
VVNDAHFEKFLEFFEAFVLLESAVEDGGLVELDSAPLIAPHELVEPQGAEEGLVLGPVSQELTGHFGLVNHGSQFELELKVNLGRTYVSSITVHRSTLDVLVFLADLLKDVPLEISVLESLPGVLDGNVVVFAVISVDFFLKDEFIQFILLLCKQSRSMSKA